MKKIVLITLLVFSFVLGVNAQTEDKAVGAGLIISLPMGDFSDFAGIGFGGTAIFEYRFLPDEPQLIGIGQIGYIVWGGEDIGAYSYSYSAVPVLVGVKYFFTPGVGFYGTSSIGLHFLSVDYDGPTFGLDFGGSSTEFSFILGAGYEVMVSPNFILDFTGTFNIVSDANYIGLRAGGKIPLN